MKGTKHTSYLIDILAVRNRNSFLSKVCGLQTKKGVLFSFFLSIFSVCLSYCLDSRLLRFVFCLSCWRKKRVFRFCASRPQAEDRCYLRLRAEKVAEREGRGLVNIVSPMVCLISVFRAPGLSLSLSFSLSLSLSLSLLVKTHKYINKCV